MLHSLGTQWPCLSFAFIPDTLGGSRTKVSRERERERDEGRRKEEKRRVEEGKEKRGN